MSRDLEEGRGGMMARERRLARISRMRAIPRQAPEHQPDLLNELSEQGRHCQPEEEAFVMGGRTELKAMPSPWIRSMWDTHEDTAVSHA